MKMSNNAIKYHLLTILISVFVAYAEDLTPEMKDQVQLVSKYFETCNCSEIVKIISFPIERPFPLPNIKDSSEFMNVACEIFKNNDNLQKRIMNIRSWQFSDRYKRVVFPANMLMLDEEGKIFKINFLSDREKTRVDSLIKNKIIRDDNTILEIKTKKYFVKIVFFKGYWVRVWDENNQSENATLINNDMGVYDYDSGERKETYTFGNSLNQFVVEIKRDKEFGLKRSIKLIKKEEIVIEESELLPNKR